MPKELSREDAEKKIETAEISRVEVAILGPGGPVCTFYTYPLRDVAILRSVPRGRGCSTGPEIRLSRPALGCWHAHERIYVQSKN